MLWIRNELYAFYLNTSHVLIYPTEHVQIYFLHTFKYISCSYLSQKMRREDAEAFYLNTSHVLIYQAEQLLSTPK